MSRWRTTRLTMPVLLVATCLLPAAASALPPSHSATRPSSGQCGASHWVASWAASPTDSFTPFDAELVPVPELLTRQTLRMVITPHLGGSTLRIHLSNRFGAKPITFGRVTVGLQSAGAAARHIKPVSFHGAGRVTIPAGEDAISDPVSLRFAAFTPLAVSMYVPATSSPPTKHWDANATSYYSAPLSGDLADQPSAKGFLFTTDAWFYIDGLDVRAASGTRSIVAFGDSITDGFVAADPASLPVTATIANTNGRYPDDLQRRLDAAQIPLSVVNAGIGSNRLLTDGEPILAGLSGLQRFREDALDQAGVSGVLVQEGINDLGLPARSTASKLIKGYRRLIAEAHADGKKIWLGTLLPASNAIVDGVSALPNGEKYREQVNAWIRHQRLADGVVDFARALQDPADHPILRPIYSGPDHLHPNLAGYREMAAAVNLRPLAREALQITTCTNTVL
jgi:lysophospholipase L1-like esterase